jgi:methyl-accepting chemotaxis protein
MSTAPSPRRRSVTGAFRDVSVAWKLRIVAVVVCTLLAAVGLIGLLYLGSSQDRLDALYSRNLLSVQSLGAMSADYKQIRIEVRGLALAQTDADAATAASRITDALKTLDETWQTFLTRSADPAGKPDRAGFEAAWADYQKALNEQVIPAGRARNLAEFNRLQREVIEPIAARIATSLDNLIEQQNTAAEAALDQSRSEYGDARLLLLGPDEPLSVCIARKSALTASGPSGADSSSSSPSSKSCTSSRASVMNVSSASRMSSSFTPPPPDQG